MTLALPTRAQEAWRYADLAALAHVWPLADEAIVLQPGEDRAETLILAGTGDQVREISVIVGAGASLAMHVLNVVQGYGRVSLTVELGQGAQFRLGAAQIAGAGHTAEIVTEVRHAAPDATSAQVVRSVAGGRSTANYLGRVVVAKGADGTDGSQSVRAMLLDRTATANARPELEIHADDVKCAHGCAVGELDAQGLFYLGSRGIPPAQARRLMLQAFLAEAFVGAAQDDILLAQALAALEVLL